MTKVRINTQGPPAESAQFSYINTQADFITINSPERDFNATTIAEKSQCNNYLSMLGVKFNLEKYLKEGSIDEMKQDLKDS